MKTQRHRAILFLSCCLQILYFIPEVGARINNNTTFFSLQNEYDPRTWDGYRINGICTFKLPQTLELRDSEKAMRSLKDTFITLSGGNTRKQSEEYAFHQKGANSNNAKTKQEALNKYARVLVEIHDNNDISQWDVMTASASDIYDFGEVLKEDASAIFGASTDFKWLSTDVQKYGSKYAIVAKYERPGADPAISLSPVHVEIYYFFFSRKLVMFTLSYRISCSSIFQNDFRNIMNTIQFDCNL